jgi:hypothetical protein
MSSYRFFFSYASETHRTSIWKNFDRFGNYLDDFFDDLCNSVALQTGQGAGDVGYRDQNRLTLASFWSKELVVALQRSRVLVSIISPHYLQSENCGREIEFFRRRFELVTSSETVPQHRVIPIFWVDRTICGTHMSTLVEQFFSGLQLREAGMPPSYPYTGLHRLYNLGEQVSRNGLIDLVAKAIVRLTELPVMPQLPGAGDFSDLPSFFVDRNNRTQQSIAAGPRGTNVVYAVGTRDEAAQYGLAHLGNYYNTRERWTPFADAPGATIELATREGLNTVGQEGLNYCDLGFPSDLNDRLRAAKKANSPVLIVLDRSSLKVPTIKSSLSDYDGLDYPHVGLITAAGSELDEPLLTHALPTKYGARRPNHLWTIPGDRTSYVLGVGDVISGLRRGLQRVGSVAIPQPAEQLPGI